MQMSNRQMDLEDAVVASALLKRHGWTAYRYFDEEGDQTYRISACWPPMCALAYDLHVPEAGWYTIHSLREAIHAVCLYSVHGGPLLEAS